jgi:hypothetical protein
MKRRFSLRCLRYGHPARWKTPRPDMPTPFFRPIRRRGRRVTLETARRYSVRTGGEEMKTTNSIDCPAGSHVCWFCSKEQQDKCERILTDNYYKPDRPAPVAAVIQKRLVWGY